MKYHKRTVSKHKNRYYMYGVHTVLAALNNNKRKIQKIYCLVQIFEKHKDKFKNVQTEIVKNDFLEKKVGRNQTHQGIVADVETIFSYDINDLDLAETEDRIVILDQITDPQNIGSIIRSAAAFGINKIILPDDNTPTENATIAKAASGCLELVQIVAVTNLRNTIDKLKKNNFWVVGLDIDGTNEINNLAKTKKLAIIIGSEGKGMRRLTKTSCDFLVKIPISEKVESLNAGIAAAITFFALQ